MCGYWLRDDEQNRIPCGNVLQYLPTINGLSSALNFPDISDIFVDSEHMKMYIEALNNKQNFDHGYKV